MFVSMFGDGVAPPSGGRSKIETKNCSKIGTTPRPGRETSFQNWNNHHHRPQTTKPNNNRRHPTSTEQNQMPTTRYISGEQCTATTLTGKRCLNNATKGRVCHIHGKTGVKRRRTEPRVLKCEEGDTKKRKPEQVVSGDEERKSVRFVPPGFQRLVPPTNSLERARRAMRDRTLGWMASRCSGRSLGPNGSLTLWPCHSRDIEYEFAGKYWCFNCAATWT